MLAVFTTHLALCLARIYLVLIVRQNVGTLALATFLGQDLLYGLCCVEV